MNYLGLLNKEEKISICTMMLTGRDCRQFFIGNEPVFLSIKKGFRAKSLTEKQALLIVINNIDNPNIAIWINWNLEQCLERVQNETLRLEEEGRSHKSALATALLYTKFSMNTEMYFKLTGNVPDEATRSAIYAELIDQSRNLTEQIETEKQQNRILTKQLEAEKQKNRNLIDHNHSLTELIEQIKDAKQNNRNLTDQNRSLNEQIKEAEKKNRTLTEQNRSLTEQVDAMIEVIRSSVNSAKAECEEKVREIEKSKAALESKLTTAQAKIAELETAAATAANVAATTSVTGANARSGNGDDADYLAQFDDTNRDALPSDSTDETISLCSIVSFNKLKRHADLNHDGRYSSSSFLRYDSVASQFTNRLTRKDGPSVNGFYGIWNWSAISNNDIKSHYNKDIAAIEVVTCTEISTIDGLVNLLKNGIKFEPHSGKAMFAFSVSGGRHIGILCSTKELQTINGKTTISTDCAVLPVYEFAQEDIMNLGKIFFYCKAFAGTPIRLYYLKSRLEIAKDVALSSLSWGVYKTRNITHAQHRAFKDFIEAVPVEDITSKIATACHCSLAAAKELLDEFLHTVDKYVDGDSLGDEIVSSAVAANATLREKAKVLVRQDWEAENTKLLSDAKGQLDALRAERESAAGELRSAQEALDKAKAEEARLTDSISAKESLAAEVEQAVAARIQKARENAADFIAEMAFAGMPAPVVQSMPQMPTRVAPVQGLTAASADTYRVCPESDNRDELEEHLSWDDVIMATELCLEDAGVAQKYGQGLAAFLCAAYIKKQPLLLVGPNAIDIIEAFSATVCAHKHGVLCCEGSYDRQVVEKIGAAGESIVLINNLLASGWINRLPEILARKDIFYVATHPYAADIQVEPGSLYGFMLPLFTEFLVNQPASGQYLSGYLAEELKEDIQKRLETESSKQLPILSDLALSPLVRTRINRLAAMMHGICPNATTDDDFMFCLFPIAYASMAVNKLTEKMADPQRGIVISKNLKGDLKFVLGDL